MYRQHASDLDTWVWRQARWMMSDGRTARPTPARSTDLHPGQRLRVWTSGGVLFSYPLQVNAQRIVIESDGQPMALGCQWRGLTQ
jgi:hypothetical protein